MTPDDIAGHDCVNFRFQSSGQELRWPFRFPDDHAIRELVPPTGTVLDHSEAVAMALAAGGGIGVSPTYVAASYVRRGELVPVLAPYAVDRFPIHALWTESRRRNPNVKAFVAVLADLFRASCPWDRLVAEAAGLAPAWALPQADARTPRAARHPSRSRKLR